MSNNLKKTSNSKKRQKIRINPPLCKKYHSKAYKEMRKYRGLVWHMEYITDRFTKISRYHWDYLNNVRLNAHNINIHIRNLETYKKEVDIYLRQLYLLNKFKSAHNIVEDIIYRPCCNDEVEKNGRFLIGSLYDHLNN
jgi:hypothetical protein